MVLGSNISSSNDQRGLRWSTVNRSMKRCDCYKEGENHSFNLTSFREPGKLTAKGIDKQGARSVVLATTFKNGLGEVVPRTKI